MQNYVSATFRSLDCAGGVCVVDGYGVQVRVRRRSLVVSDGIGRFRRERSFAKALVGIKRLVILSHEGAITLEALRWLTDAGIAFLEIDRDGEVIAASASYGLSDPRLRRALALATTNTAGLEIARFLLHAKIAGQERNLTRPIFANNVRAEVSDCLNVAKNARSIPEILTAEARGALAYWGAWKDVSLRFARKEEKSIPEYWRTFGQRRSPITDSPRLAANPANATLNYLYALLEAECRFACLACGLDPGLGVFHADQKSRDSLALDLMEAVRPKVDAYLLDLIEARTFSSKDFVETRRGVCRVLAPLTHTLAETAPRWAEAVAPVVENVAALVVSGGELQLRLPTPLTQANRSAGRNRVRRNPTKAKPARAKLATTCANCGGALPSPDRMFCNDCLPEHEKEKLVLFCEAGSVALARLRAEGRDPTTTDDAKKKLRDAHCRHVSDAARWDAEHEPCDRAEFIEKILPGLQGVPLSRMMDATGLSLRYCSKIRRGRVPHPMHWDALRLCERGASGAGVDG